MGSFLGINYIECCLLMKSTFILRKVTKDLGSEKQQLREPEWIDFNFLINKNDYFKENIMVSCGRIGK